MQETMQYSGEEGATMSAGGDPEVYILTQLR